MTKEESISLALKEKAEILAKKTARYEAEIKELSENMPRYRALSSELSALGARLALTALGGDMHALDSLREKMNAVSEEKAQLLKEAGIEDIKYDCPVCRDTGKVEGEICSCVKELAKKIQLEAFSKSAPFEKSTFDKFELSYYTDPAALKRMTGIMDLAQSFASEFSKKTSENLLFMGNTGLGKTHLSLAIAGEVIKKGYDVIYGSAYNLFSEMESEHFSEHTNERYENAVGCDLLVIDDLGGEFVSPYIQSLVYNIINTRLLSSKPTIINTNLSLKEIENRYTPRVASRLAGEYTAKMFLGSDVRQIKVLK